MTSKEEFEAQAKALAELYIKSLPAKRQAIKTAWANLEQHDYSAGQAGALARLAHNLAGSAGLYGFRDISSVAMDTEILLSAAIADDEISPAALGQLKDLLAQLDLSLNESLA